MVAVIAVLSAIAIPAMKNLVPASSGATATRNLNYLNGAVQTYNQAVEELNTNATPAQIMVILQTRDTNRHGSPYLPTNLKTNSTSSTSTYRARWSGRMFEQIQPGASGAGLDLLKLM